MQRSVRAVLVGCADHLPGVLLDDPVDVTAAGSDVEVAMGRRGADVVPALLPMLDQFLRCEVFERVWRLRAEEGSGLGVAQRELSRSAAKMRFEHIRVGRV